MDTFSITVLSTVGVLTVILFILGKKLLKELNQDD